MKARKPDESDAHYIKRLEDQNRSLQGENASIKKWGEALNEAVTTLSCDGSLAFQLMAEKAGVRGHPSVTAVVELFDTISHPQWRGEKVIEKIRFPQFWDLDSETAWSGDADMALNSPVADAIDLLEHLKWKVADKRPMLDEIHRVIGGLQKALKGIVEGMKERRGFKPKHFEPFTGNHFKDMTEAELRELVSALGWMALDLAQDMAFANECLRRDLRAATYRRVCADLYGMSHFSCEPPNESFNIKVLGAESAPF